MAGPGSRARAMVAVQSIFDRFVGAGSVLDRFHLKFTYASGFFFLNLPPCLELDQDILLRPPALTLPVTAEDSRSQFYIVKSTY